MYVNKIETMQEYKAASPVISVQEISLNNTWKGKNFTVLWL